MAHASLPGWRGPASFTSVCQLTQAIGTFIDAWNDRPRPFAWTKDADEILASIQRAKTKTSAGISVIRR